MTSERQGIIFDLDDTLVDTSDVYWRARSLFISILVSEGINEKLALDTFESVDTEMIGVHGHTPERYGLSMKESYAKLVLRGQMNSSAAVENMIVSAASIVPQTVPSLIDGSLQLLEWASGRYELALLTRGVSDMQSKKIKKWGLDKYFKSIMIVSKKGPEEFSQSISTLGLKPDKCWAIGDSIKSDINPALQAGARAILFVYTHHAYHWQQEYGSAPVGPYYRIHKLPEAISVLEAPANHRIEESLAPLLRDDFLSS